MNAARSSVSNWFSRYKESGFDGLKDAKLGRPSIQLGYVICQLLFFLVLGTPQNLGFERNRWSSESLSHVISEYARFTAHRTTIRRWLPELGTVWPRAGPTLRILDPHRDDKLAARRKALDNCDTENPVFYEDEVDFYLNPKISTDWGFWGKQYLMSTQGQNDKYFLAGYRHAQTGKVSYIDYQSMCFDLFIDMLESL